jgi:glucose-1-phosphate cytidylyltransferase
MQVVILAGGFGTRLSEETEVIPKPMVRIGNIPILRHIMNYYLKFGHRDFVIALGYKSEVINDYFEGLLKDEPDLDWNLKLVDTGLQSQTGGRIKRLETILDNEFMLTYGDGLSNVNLDELLKQHRLSKKIATLTAVHPPARFGKIEIQNGNVTKFAEKDPSDAGWINGGFFCMRKEICDFIFDDQTPLEALPLERLVLMKELGAFQHSGWWQPMDTLRDKKTLETIWSEDNVPWLMN